MSRLATAAVTVAVTTLAAGVVTAVPADASPTVKIAKIKYAQVGNNLDTEYIVFKNTTGSPRKIGGWKIISAPSTDNQYKVFPATTIPAGGTVTLYTGSGSNSPGKRYWGATSPRWDNAGDKAILKNGSGTTVDTCQYAGGGTTAYC
ncbi:MAG: lamin tail domain-containing protein [Nocardioidaceae bacterium]